MPALSLRGHRRDGLRPAGQPGRVIGKFMLYFGEPHAVTAEEHQLALVIAAQVAFAIERTRAEDQARRSEEQLRFALDAASMGTFEWNLVANTVQWSPNLERVHGLPPGTLRRHVRELRTGDSSRRSRLRARDNRTCGGRGAPYEVEYRIVTQAGAIRWLEGKGRVEHEHARRRG